MFFSSTKSENKSQDRFCSKVGGWGGNLAQIMYTHVSKRKVIKEIPTSKCHHIEDYASAY
jgi:hypothetical protein